jgi:disease resistance protein RPM1
MALVMGALGSIAPKLLELLKDEYKLQKGLKKQVKSLSDELQSVHAALRKVAETPWDKLDEQVKIWARQVREASYDMEDILDTFLVRVEDHGPAKKGRLKRALKNMGDLFSNGKARHDIAHGIQDIKMQLQEVADRRSRCKVDEIVAKPIEIIPTVDPRLAAMFKEVEQLVGIKKSRDDIISMLQVDENAMKIVSIVGVGGLGKTTLAKASFDKLKSLYQNTAFVSVGRNPNFGTVFKDILFYLDKIKYKDIHTTGRGVDLLIRELQEFLHNKRYPSVTLTQWFILIFLLVSVMYSKYFSRRQQQQ